jgi:thiol-disulfide isomerase/thioredoxin
MSGSAKPDPRFADASNVAPFRLWIMLGLAFVATFLVIRRYAVSPAVGGKADYTWVLSDLDGKPVMLSTYAGRPIFLNMWATWCGPCQTEMPSIARLASNPKLSKVAFLCVSIEESPDPVKAFVASKRPPMTMLMASAGVPKIFHTDGIPATFLIAPDGRIVRAENVSQEWDVPDVVTMLEGLAREAK